MKLTDEEIENISGLQTTQQCPSCGSVDTDEVQTSCPCHCGCWSAPHCNECGLTGAGNSSGGMWFKPSYW